MGAGWAASFFNNYDSSGTSFEFTPGLTEFSRVTPILAGSPASEPVEYYSIESQAVKERALFGEISRDLGERWRITAGGRWFGYRIETGSLTEFPYTPMYNSPFTDFASDDRGVLFKASVSYRFDDQTNAYFTRSEGYRIGGGNNFRVCTDEEITLLTDADPGNDPPQSGCIYEDQALIRPDTTTNYELGAAPILARRKVHGKRHAVPRGLDGHPSGRRDALQRAADHGERRRGGEPRRRARGRRRADERVALARDVVLYARSAEPGLSRPARRGRGRLQGRPSVWRAAAAR